MSITYYTYHAEESAIVRIPRTCSSCGRQWVAELKVTAEGEAESSSRGDPDAYAEASKKARKKLEVLAQAKKDDVDEHVVCPTCGCFSIRAMERHFPRGYATGLLSKYRQEEWLTLLRSLGLALGGALVTWFGIALTLEALEKSDWALMAVGIVIGIVGTGAGLYGGYGLLRFGRCMFAQRGVARMVNAQPEERLLQLAVKCYRRNGNSLRHGNAWIEALSREAQGRQTGRNVPSPQRVHEAAGVDASGAGTHKKRQAQCARCGVVLLTEEEVKEKYAIGTGELWIGDMEHFQQVVRDRDAIGVTCRECARSYCSACMLRYGKPHLQSGGIGCLACGGRMTEFHREHHEKPAASANDSTR